MSYCPKTEKRIRFYKKKENMLTNPGQDTTPARTLTVTNRNKTVITLTDGELKIKNIWQSF
jgi:hypothetical protein